MLVGNKDASPAELEEYLDLAMALLKTRAPPSTGRARARAAMAWSPDEIKRYFIFSPWVIQHGSRTWATYYEPINNKGRLRSALLKLGRKDDPNLVLQHKSGNYLNVSVQGPHAFVQLTRDATDSAYLTPFQKGLPRNRRIEVPVGDTPTTFPLNRCVSLETMVRIVLHWYEHEELPAWVTWKEI